MKGDGRGSRTVRVTHSKLGAPCTLHTLTCPSIISVSLSLATSARQLSSNKRRPRRRHQAVKSRIQEGRLFVDFTTLAMSGGGDNVHTDALLKMVLNPVELSAPAERLQVSKHSAYVTGVQSSTPPPRQLRSAHTCTCNISNISHSCVLL